MNHPKTPIQLGARAYAPLAARFVAGLAMVAVVMGSAVWTKRTGALPALVGLERTPAAGPSASSITPVSFALEEADAGPAGQVELIAIEEVTKESPEWSAETRWFDGRPVRPARVLVMKVTGYSPDSRSCGIYADGQTATLHSVWTNGMNLVAADPKVLPYGSMITVPGYASEQIVPVLDCGGAIKGNRLDLLFPTHRRALVWGVQTLRVTLWDYADGEPAPNPRKVR
ncbi:MAG: 3D domain-containing protein [Planctomycetota bacterium]